MKRFDFDEFLWFIVLILLDISIVYLLFTGKMNFYIGEKMIKYSYTAILMITILVIVQFKNVFTSKGNSNIKTKLVPIILTLILGTISINTQETFKHNELNKELKGSSTSRIDIKSLYEHESDYNAIENENNKQDILIVNENNPMVLEDIRVNPKKYIGRKLEIHGFMCKENYLNKNQFIIGRMIMTCCAADSKVVGIIGEYDKAYDINENQNIIVKGTIASSIIKDNNNISHKVPIVIIEKLGIEN